MSSIFPRIKKKNQTSFRHHTHFVYFSTAVNMRLLSCLCAWISSIRLQACVLVKQNRIHEMKSATLSVRSSAHPQCVWSKHTQTHHYRLKVILFFRLSEKQNERNPFPPECVRNDTIVHTNTQTRLLPTTTNATAMKTSPCVVGCESALLVLWTSSGSRSTSLGTTENCVFIRRACIFAIERVTSWTCVGARNALTWRTSSCSFPSRRFSFQLLFFNYSFAFRIPACSGHRRCTHNPRNYSIYVSRCETTSLSIHCAVTLAAGDVRWWWRRWQQQQHQHHVCASMSRANVSMSMGYGARCACERVYYAPIVCFITVCACVLGTQLHTRCIRLL